MRLVYLGGTIRRSEQMSFNRLIFRSTRGKAYTSFYDMYVRPEDKITGFNDSDLLVYIIMFQEGGYMRDKIMKVCSNTGEPV
jgi:hypothetical protein